MGSPSIPNGGHVYVISHSDRAPRVRSEGSVHALAAVSQARLQSGVGDTHLLPQLATLPSNHLLLPCFPAALASE